MVFDKEQIGGLAMLLGVDRRKVGIIEFTSLVERPETGPASIPGSPAGKTPGLGSPGSPAGSPSTPARQREIEGRMETMRGRNYVLPVKGEYWEKLADCMDGRPPSFAGEINGMKAEELGLYDPSKTLVRVYSDSVAVPYLRKQS